MTYISIHNTNNESMLYYDVIYIHKQNGRKLRWILMMMGMVIQFKPNHMIMGRNTSCPLSDIAPRCTAILN